MIISRIFSTTLKKRFQSWAIKFWILAFDQVPLDLSTDYHYVWNKRFLNSFIFLLDYFLNSFDSESSNFRDVFEWVHLISVQKWPETSFLKIPNISKNQTFIKRLAVTTNVPSWSCIFYFSKSTFNIFIRFSILLLKSSFRTFPHPNAAPWRTIRGYNQTLKSIRIWFFKRSDFWVGSYRNPTRQNLTIFKTLAQKSAFGQANSRIFTIDLKFL